MDRLTINQTMKCLNVSRQSTMAWLASGKFPNAEKDSITGWWLIPVDDVEAIRQKLIKQHERSLKRIAVPAIEFLENGED